MPVFVEVACNDVGEVDFVEACFERRDLFERRIGLPRAINDRYIPARASGAAIDQRLLELETIARVSGHALGVGAPYPVTLERLSAWLGGLEAKGFALAPVSAIAATGPDR